MIGFKSITLKKKMVILVRGFNFRDEYELGFLRIEDSDEGCWVIDSFEMIAQLGQGKEKSDFNCTSGIIGGLFELNCLGVRTVIGGVGL
ncbi:hypothetical protein C5167_016361 [Papaver somniferum]|nr:hypothetical protein C5167_016361 [Papaver somniferum]